MNALIKVVLAGADGGELRFAAERSRKTGEIIKIK